MESDFIATSEIPLNQEGKISSEVTSKEKRIKIDVGLSYCAPYSNLWLNKLPDCIVFGFEPNPECISSIKTGKGFEAHSHKKFRKNLIGKRFFLIPYAVDRVISPVNLDFYLTNQDPGISSLYCPNQSEYLKEKISVPCMSLEMFLDRIDWSKTRGYIDHLKIDSQGNDLRIVKSAGKYLTERIVYVTVEAGDERFFYKCDKEDTNYTPESITEYMVSKGFVKVITPLYQPISFSFLKNDFHPYNLTFFNTKFIGEDTSIFDCSLLDE